MNLRIFSLWAALCLLATSALAQSPAELRQRMGDRLPQLDALKEKGAIGENNQGYVETRGASNSEAASLVSDENGDRQKAYALIAKSAGASADSVGRARARQIAANSRSGVWIQDEKGHWKRK